MKQFLFAALAAILFSGVAYAQGGAPSANPVSDTIREMLESGSKNLAASAELMPAEKYTFHPTPAQWTFAQLMVHVVQTNVALCSAIGGTPTPPPATPTDKDAKDAIVKAVKDSFDTCRAALANVTDSQVGAAVPMGRGQTSRARLMIVIAADWADHYSTAAGYLRLNGILPPTAQPKK